MWKKEHNLMVILTSVLAYYSNGFWFNLMQGIKMDVI